MPANRLPPVALVQMEVRPGRPDLNVARMRERIDEAREAGARVVVFSEMCVPGYIVGDLWELDALVEDFVAYGEVVRAASEGVTVLFGNVAVDRDRIGEDGRLRKYNAVHVCSDGRWVARPGTPPGLPDGVHPKTLHPNYRFFDDDRHFYGLRRLAAERGRPIEDWMVPFEIALPEGDAFRFGVQLCEDLWCQDYRHAGELLDTARAFHARGAQAVFNLSCSPWSWHKSDKRHRTVGEVLARSPVPYFYVNQVGAQNNGKNVLVFDGDTTAYGTDAAVHARAPAWRESLVLVRDGEGAIAPPPGEADATYEGIRAGIRHLDHVRASETRWLVGVSGGIDSSVVTCLLAQTVGPERVFAVNMPTRYNAGVTRENARVLCERLGIEYLVCPIQDLYELLAAKIRESGFAKTPGEYSRLVDENLQARVRGSDVLAGLAAKLGLLFTCNGNKTEIALGYTTLYGDVNGALAPLGDLYKTQVYALGRHLNDRVFGTETIPENLFSGEVVPSAELSEDQDVTRGLGDPIKYGYHDALLRQLVDYRRHPADVLGWYAERGLFSRLDYHDAERFRGWFPDAAVWVADLEWVERQLRINYFKRVQAPPIVVLSKRAFGFDYRESQLPEYRPRSWQRLRDAALAVDPAEQG